MSDKIMTVEKTIVIIEELTNEPFKLSVSDAGDLILDILKSESGTDSIITSLTDKGVELETAKSIVDEITGIKITGGGKKRHSKRSKKQRRRKTRRSTRS
jgi:hypothetical protein